MARPQSKIPTISLRNGVYYANWYDSDERRTRRCSLGTREEKTAQARFAAFLSDQTGARERRNASVIFGQDVIEAYRTEHVERHARSALRICSALKNLESHFGMRDVSSLFVRDFENYAERRRAGAIGARPAVDSTVIYEIGLFKAAVAHAVRHRRLDSRQAPVWWTPERPTPKSDKWLTIAEIETLIGAATTRRVENFIQLGYWTAGRKTAVLNITTDRVDRRRAKIDLHPPQWKRTRKRNAVVPIVSGLEKPLESMMLFAPDNGYLLGSNSPIDGDFTSTVRAAKLADKGVTPHWLRHSRATHLLQAGKPLFHVAGLLGDTTATVERIYGHHCTDNLKDALE